MKLIISTFSIRQAFASQASLTFLSRLSGFLRVALFAAFYGGSVEADLFLTAMILPDLMYRFLSEGLISSVAVPLFVQEDSDEFSHRRLWQLAWSLCFLAVGIVFLLILLRAYFSAWLAPGLPPSEQGRLASVWGILSVYLLFVLPTALFSAYLNARGIFARPALGPLLVNLVIIGGLLLVRGGPVEYVAITVTLGALVQGIWLIFLVHRCGAPFRWPSWPNVDDWLCLWLFYRNSAPVACWLGLLPIIPMFERFLLSSQAIGSVAMLSYIDKIMNLPLGIISISLAVVVFPVLSSTSGRKRWRLCVRAVWVLVLLVLPIVLLLSCAAPSVVALLFRRGCFSVADVGSASTILSAYCWYVFPASVAILLNRWHFAGGFFGRPFVIGLAGISCQLILDFFLVRRCGSVGVGWGATVAAHLQMLLLLASILHLLRRKNGRYALVPEAVAPLVAFWLGSACFVPLLIQLESYLALQSATPGWRTALSVLGVWLILQITVVACGMLIPGCRRMLDSVIGRARQ